MPVWVPAKPPLNEEPGREDPGECEFKSIFNFLAIVTGGAAFGRSTFRFHATHRSRKVNFQIGIQNTDTFPSRSSLYDKEAEYDRIIWYFDDVSLRKGWEVSQSLFQTWKQVRKY